MTDTKIKLELTIDEINFILQTLQELPYKDSNKLIAEIITQGNKKPEEVTKK